MTTAARFERARERARVRRIEWTLTLEQYRALLASGSCSYCGGALPTTGIGLDRLDNHAGYELANVVPCCRWCNGWGWRAMGFLTPAEMRAVFRAVPQAQRPPVRLARDRTTSRSGRASERLDLRKIGLSGLVKAVLSPERLTEARRLDGATEIEALQRERGFRP